MSHEPECDDFQNGNSDGDCICHLTRPAYQRGVEDAVRAVRELHIKANKPDQVPEWMVEWYGKTEEEYCRECFKAYPCPTICALDGEQE